jgi:hypothetical protein
MTAPINASQSNPVLNTPNAQSPLSTESTNPSTEASQNAVEAAVVDKLKNNKNQAQLAEDLQEQAQLFKKLLAEGGVVPEAMRAAIANTPQGVPLNTLGVPTQMLHTMAGITLSGVELSAMSTDTRIQNIVDNVAKAILVSDVSLQKSANVTQEVLVVLKPEVLPGSQVSISRQSGELQVVFQTNVKDSALFLNQNQSLLQNTLVGRLGETVQVRVQEVYSNAMNQSSQGGQNEGRSRGHYIAQEDAETG